MVILSLIIVIILIILLICIGFYSIAYMKLDFPQMRLKFDKIEWSPYHENYIINFKDKDNQIYSCVIEPQYFPVNLGQGYLRLKKHIEKIIKIDITY